MTEVIETWRKEAVYGELKKVVILGDSATATGYTVDTDLDAANGKGALFSYIIDAYHVGLTGTRVDASWVAATGVVTLGTVASTPESVVIVIEGY